MGFRERALEGLGLNEQFWHGKKVLVTGHTGFKGSWLSLWLQKAGAEVIGYALAPPTEPSLFELARTAEEMVSLEGDVRDLSSLKSMMKEHQPDIVIHMAAQAIVRYSYANPVETFQTNIIGTVNVLEAVRRSPCTRVCVVVTSDKCYDNKAASRPFHEGDPMGGRDPYSSSKGCAELVTVAYRDSYFAGPGSDAESVAVASVRAGNVIGGGDWAQDRLIPDILKSLLNDQVVLLRNPDAVRPWQHVLDPLNGYLLLAEKLWHEGPEFAGAWNFGPEPSEAKPVAWVADELLRLWNPSIRWQRAPGNHPYEAKTLELDAAKARRSLGWSPQISLGTALEWIVQWYDAWRAGEDVRSVTLSQISKFEAVVPSGNG